MFEKNLNIAFLLDFYGEVLGDRTRELLEMYYCDDMSLAEIAEAVGITRQGVRGGIKKGEEELLFLEERLGLAARHRRITEEAKSLLSLTEAYAERVSDEETRELICAIRSYTETVLEKNKED